MRFDLGDDYDQIEEELLAARGSYDLRIVDFDPVEDENTGNTRAFRATIEFEGKPDLTPFSHYLNLPEDAPREGQTEEKWETMNLLRNQELESFLEAFSVSFSKKDDGSVEFDPAEVSGATGNCRVSIRTDTRGASAGTQRNVLQLAEPAPEGKYDISIISAAAGGNSSEDDDDYKYVRVGIAIKSNKGRYQAFTHFLNLPTDKPKEGQDAEKWQKSRTYAIQGIRRFGSLFNLDLLPEIDTEKMIGATAEQATIRKKAVSRKNPDTGKYEDTDEMQNYIYFPARVSS